MSELIDKAIFSDLESCDPGDVVARTGCEFNETTRQYFLKVWGQRYCVDLNQGAVRPDGPGRETYRDYLYLFILYYLMKAKKIPPSGEWVSEKDIPGGAAFFRGPHTIPTGLVTARFGNDLKSFQKACENEGGYPVGLADAAYTFELTPCLPVAVLYWQGDEDFSSETRLLFDRTIGQQLPLDIIYALAVEICHSLERSV